jgi:hypothetical protein
MGSNPPLEKEIRTLGSNNIRLSKQPRMGYFFWLCAISFPEGEPYRFLARLGFLDFINTYFTSNFWMRFSSSCGYSGVKFSSFSKGS